jgi:hypothetical protein
MENKIIQILEKYNVVADCDYEQIAEEIIQASTEHSKLNLADVSVCTVYKVDFTYLKGNPVGGGKYWESETIMFDAKDGKELNEQIKQYIEQNSGCYREFYRTKSIVKI